MEPSNWLLDVSFEPPCFVPYSIVTGDICWGLSVVSGRCPGNLVGLVHTDGQDRAEAWENNNPNWYDKYKSDVGK